MTGCQHKPVFGQQDKAGMLVETNINDQAWGQQGYKGLKAIQEKFDMDVYFKEGVQTLQGTRDAVNELVDQGVTVIFGHSSLYSNHFKQIHKEYLDVQFIYFNGGFTAENVTSLNFSSDAMGFFGGMVAGEMTKSNRIGLIASFEWQPEVEGFYAGVKHQNPEAKIELSYTNDWGAVEKALSSYETMNRKGADVFYPAGDSFNIPIIEKAQADGNYAIGYVKDQSHVAERTVLTSTVQRLDHVYVSAMERFLDDDLPGKPLTFDFQENAIELGEYSPAVPSDQRERVEKAVKTYKNSGKLPNEL